MEIERRRPGDSREIVVDRVFECTDVDGDVVAGVRCKGSGGVDRDRGTRNGDLGIGGKHGFEDRVVEGALDRNVLGGNGRHHLVECQNDVGVHGNGGGVVGRRRRRDGRRERVGSRGEIQRRRCGNTRIVVAREVAEGTHVDGHVVARGIRQTGRRVNGDRCT